MQVGLISVYESIMAYGLRCLSSVLKQAAISTRMVFLPRETEGIRRDGFRYAFSEGLLAELAELVKSCDLVGISVMSNYFENAVQITKYLNEHTAAQIIWGGIHTTLKPEECLEHADLICVGEGEDALLELIKKMSESNGSEGIRNIWYKKGGEIIRTPLRPLETNLDQYPYPDYSLDDVFILYEGVIRPMTEDLLMYYLDYPHDIRTGPTYVALMSRGCTYSCTYCCNNALRRVYPNSWKVQRRSTKNFVGELVNITRRYPKIRWITVYDDVFMDKIEQVREFCQQYKENLSLPVWVTGFQPSMVDEEKIALLVDAGMKRVRMGIQTGSIETLHKVYKRPGSQEQLARAVSILSKFTDKIDPPSYDFIVDNPWENDEERYKTLEFLVNIPRPFTLLTFSLTYYPGWVLSFLIRPFMYKLNWTWIPFIIFWACKVVNLKRVEIWSALRGNWLPLRRVYKAYFVKNGKSY